MVSAAAEFRQITGSEREARVSEAAFADEVAGRRTLWWAGVPGLDPLHPVGDARHAAQIAAMACAARVLGPDVNHRTRFRGGASPIARDFYRWLAGHSGDIDAWLRRLALRLACDIPGLPADEALGAAQALYAAIADR